MSRTFRRKNFEAENNTSWDVRGSKTAGFYTHRRWHFEHTGRMWSVFTVPTKEQYYKEYWRNHGESKTANSRSPNHSYRHMRMKQNRAITRQELHKYSVNPDYEVMVEVNPRNCWWDWS